MVVLIGVFWILDLVGRAKIPKIEIWLIINGIGVKKLGTFAEIYKIVLFQLRFSSFIHTQRQSGFTGSRIFKRLSLSCSLATGEIAISAKWIGRTGSRRLFVEGP